MAMIRARENPIAIQAGVLALLMHGLFLFLLIFSFSWKHVRPSATAAEVELWDNLPKPVAVTPPPEIKPEPEPPPPPPEIKPEPKPEPPPEPKAEIQIKPKPVEVKKPPKEEPKKPDPALKKQEEDKKAEQQKQKDQLNKLKQAMLQDVPDQETPPAPAVDTKAQQAQSAADAKRAADILAASSGVVNQYTAKIVAKIKRYVNRQPCGTDSKLELAYAITLFPDGHVSGSPRLTKASSLSACDQAVERAILQAQPLPLPPQPELFDQFRNLNLNFRPNEDQ